MVKSQVTKEMPASQLKEIQENLKNASYKEIRRFRDSFNPNDMGFFRQKGGCVMEIHKLLTPYKLHQRLP